MRRLTFGTLASFVFIAAWLLIVLIAPSSTIAGTFRDDFSNESDFLNDKQLREGGVWGEDISKYTWEDGAVKISVVGPWGYMLITGDYSWKDYTVECKVKVIRDDAKQGGPGLIIRRTCIDCMAGYNFNLEANRAYIGKGTAQGFLPLTETQFERKTDTWYSLKVVAEGDRLEFYVDNQLILQANNATYPAGKVGFEVGTRVGILEALLDDFVMTGLEVKDGGHWDPEAHPESISVQSTDKLAATWARIKSN